MNTLIRDNYGALHNSAYTSPTDAALLDGAHRLIAQGVTAKKILGAYDTLKRDRKGRWDGKALRGWNPVTSWI